MQDKYSIKRFHNNTHYNINDYLVNHRITGSSKSSYTAFEQLEKLAGDSGETCSKPQKCFNTLHVLLI